MQRVGSGGSRVSADLSTITGSSGSRLCVIPGDAPFVPAGSRLEEVEQSKFAPIETLRLVAGRASRALLYGEADDTLPFRNRRRWK